MKINSPDTRTHNEAKSRSKVTRRTVLRRLGAGAVAGAAWVAAGSRPAGAAAEAEGEGRRGRIRQSVVPWCFRPMAAVELVNHAAQLGLGSVELIGPEHWPLLKEKGMVCAIAGSHGFAKGFAHLEEHEECLTILRERIDLAAAAGFPAVITFSGFRRGLSMEEGTRNMVAGLKAIAGHAERKGVTVCLEMLNSRVEVEMKGHPDYFCDDIDHSVEIIKQVGSERVKVLWDIYHVQIMNGDLIRRIREQHPYIGHYHTAGNPGRNEIDDSQEINYPAVMRAIVEAGYQGFVGQEFIPTGEPVTALREAVRLCDV
jgi:hydroxypyruvate isomerase